MTTKLSKTALVVGLILYFLYQVVANAPATLLASVVHKNVPVLWLNSVEGTVWNGRAGAAQVDVNPYELPLGKVSWQLNPFSLLALNPCVTFEALQPGQTFAGELCHSAGGTSKVKDLTADGSMAFINSLANTELKGRGSLSVQRAEFSKTRVKQLSAQLTWHNARILILDEWISFGSYAAKFKENELGGVSAEVFDVDAPLKLEMTAHWVASGGWTADGTVIPGENTPPKIIEGLKFIGEEIEPGKYQFSWR